MSVTGYLRFPHVAGEKITFVAEDDVWLASNAGGPARRLTSDSVPATTPRLSADGETLCWVSRRSGEPEVFTVPTSGGVPRQLTYFGHASTALAGYLPDGRIVVISAGAQPFRSRTWAYAIDLHSEYPVPELLPYGPVNALADSGRGPIAVGTGYLRDPAHWKRYRGGTAGRLWTAPSPDGEFSELLSAVPGQKTNPVWIGERLAFLSDLEGHGNVYSVNTDGSELRRHTDHAEFYARQLSSDGASLVYQHAGQVWLLDSVAADSTPRRLELTLGSSRAGRSARRLDPAKSLGDVSVDRTGRASAAEVRGSIVWLTHRDGPARTLASAPGVRHRLPVVLHSDAGPAAAYVTDAGGEDAIEVAAADGTVHRHAAGQLGRVLEVHASPDGELLALSTHDGRLLTVAVSSGTVTEIEGNPNGEPSGLAFSPDSKWLAYSAAESQQGLRSIRIVELDTGTVSAITDTRFLDSDPCFSIDGKYLFFLSARTFDPVYDAHVFDLAFPLATRPYLVTLARDTPSPFEPELLGRPAAGDAGKPQDKQQDKPSEAGAPEVVVELDGIADRVVPFPVAAGLLGNLMPAKDGALWTSSPIAGELGESRTPDDDVRASLQRWDFVSRKQLELAPRIDRVAIAGDGSCAVIVDHEVVRAVPAVRKAAEDGSDTITLDLSRIRLDVDPAAEWRNMFEETARLMGQHFWRAGMSGLDWDAAVAKYRPLVDALASRDDLSDLLWEVNGETGSSHAYETPPAVQPAEANRPAFLGADLARAEDGSWVVARVIPGDNSARGARSPLTAPGVEVRTGAVVVAINGQRVGLDGPAPLLKGTAGSPVEVRISDGDVERSVVVRPIADETELRYLDWVAGRRAVVHAETGGRVGYVHIPDMVSAGWAAFHRDLAVEMARDALIVDTRDNRGGHTSQLVIEKLARRIIGWDIARHYPTASYPSQAARGPLVSIANEWAGSDGDIVNAAFQSLELGPVIGTRTWGGVIGIDGKYQLVDGTTVTQPRYAFWFEKFGWGVENHGVTPDVVVEFPPHAWAAGSDPQLAAAISRIVSDLEARPARPMPDPANAPSLQAPELPPRP